MKEDSFWQLAIATNAAFKGLLGHMGQSGHICERAIPIEGRLAPEEGVEPFITSVVQLVIQTGVIQDGDVVIMPDKLFAIAQGRIGPRDILTSPDPKTVSQAQRQSLSQRWSDALGFRVDPIHLLLADQYVAPDGKRLATLGTDDHNAVAYQVAQRIREATGYGLDVVVSDTDTGIDVRQPLIGTVTIGATPLGATKGLNLYECMRCACAAEFCRGHTRNIPIVVCRPAERCRGRGQIGEPRTYGCRLDANQEEALAYD